MSRCPRRQRLLQGNKLRSPLNVFGVFFFPGLPCGSRTRQLGIAYPSLAGVPRETGRTRPCCVPGKRLRVLRWRGARDCRSRQHALKITGRLAIACVSEVFQLLHDVGFFCAHCRTPLERDRDNRSKSAFIVIGGRSSKHTHTAPPRCRAKYCLPICCIASGISGRRWLSSSGRLPPLSGTM